MTAPIDIECPACGSTAGNYCTSVTVDPNVRQRRDGRLRECSRCAKIGKQLGIP